VNAFSCENAGMQARANSAAARPARTNMRMDDNPPEADHIIAAPDGVEVVTSCASLGESVAPAAFGGQ
jgi:hypothetical protein